MTDSRPPAPGTRNREPGPRIPALYLGIDGGQTGTRALLADASGRVLGRGRGGPSNHVEAPGGRERLRTAVTDSANAALRAAGLGDVSTVAFAAVHCGMTGEADYKTAIISPIFRTDRLTVGHDAPAALAGATLGAPGIIVIAGTGSVVYGENGHGESARAGGWGYVFGDEGSGFGLARDAIRAALDALDGVGPETALVEVLTRHFDVGDLRDLPMMMYNGHVSRDAVAGATPIVLDCWRRHDPVAMNVVDRGVEAIARRVHSVSDRLTLAAPLVCLAGGVFRDAAYVAAFGSRVRTLVPDARVGPGRLGAAAGAVLLAYRSAHVALTDALREQLIASAVEE